MSQRQKVKKCWVLVIQAIYISNKNTLVDFVFVSKLNLQNISLASKWPKSLRWVVGGCSKQLQCLASQVEQNGDCPRNGEISSYQVVLDKVDVCLQSALNRLYNLAQQFGRNRHANTQTDRTVYRVAPQLKMANILASGPQIKEVRTLCFLKLQKLRKIKWPQFYNLFRDIRH